VRGRQTAASRAKAATLTTLKRDLGKEKIGHLDRQKLINYGKMRADQGAGPVTLSIDIGVITMIITHAAAVHGLDISPEPVDLARVALKRLGLIGKGTERDRRPTTDELNRLFRYRVPQPATCAVSPRKSLPLATTAEWPCCSAVTSASALPIFVPVNIPNHRPIPPS